MVLNFYKLLHAHADIHTENNQINYMTKKNGSKFSLANCIMV